MAGTTSTGHRRYEVVSVQDFCRLRGPVFGISFGYDLGSPLRPAEGLVGGRHQRNLETRSACSRMTRALSSVSVPVGAPS